METTSIRASLTELTGLVGTEFGPSAWREISQEEVGRFAELTGDRNPVHLDPGFAATTPFGGTIVHGYFTLCLVVPLMAEVFEVTGVGVGVNYGLNRLRFPAPVPVGARVRVRGVIGAVTEVPGGVQVQADVTFEVDGSAKPVCVAEMVLRYYA